MLSREENNLVTQVGAGTPLGDVVRRYWVPVCTSDQLPGPDSDPLQVRLFGENFVAFRDSNGRVGLLDELCMHRGASLALGRVEDCGIRCIYHGWKFAVDGTVMDTPNHFDPRMKANLRAPAYPVNEAGGLVWAYLGPADKQPAFQRHRFMDAPQANRFVLRVDVNANYLQLCEGGVDSSHVGILHSDAARPNWLDKSIEVKIDQLNPGSLTTEDNAPRLEIEDTPFGFHYAAWRKTGRSDDGKDIENVRIVPFVLPWTRIIPSLNSYYTVMEVPKDDENTATYIVVDGEQPVDRERVIKILGLDDERFYNATTCEFTALPAQRWGQARDKMKSNWTGLRGLEQEDAIISLSMGPVFDRSKEHLVAADRAVMRLRRRILENIKLVQAGEQPLGARLPDLTGLLATDLTVPAGTSWQEIAAPNLKVSA
jgi:phthalate 4,5-dioxygenase oxygenase subunit